MGGPSLKSLFRVLAFIRPYWILSSLTLVAAAGVTALDLVPPWIIKLIIDDVIVKQQEELLPWLIGALLAVHTIRNIAASLRIRFNNILEQKVIYDIREKVFEALQRLSITYYEHRQTGEIMSRVSNDVENIERIFIDGLEALLMASLTLIGISIILFSLNWKLALLSLLPIPVLVIFAVLYTKTIHRFYHTIRRTLADLNAYLQDALSGIRETMSFNRHSYEQQRFSQRSSSYCESTLQVMRLWAAYSPSMIFVGSLGSVLILWYGTIQVQSGHLTVGELVAFLAYVALFYVPINQIHSVNNMLQSALAAGDRVIEILDTTPEVQDQQGVTAPPHRLRGDVAAKNVTFGYRPSTPVLTNMSFAVQAGERIALVGHSGAGKSTFFKLLMRFYDVKQGSIILDNHDLRTLPLSYVRDHIGMVQQEPFLFNDTVRENIAYGDLSANLHRIKIVATAARAHEFITALPEQYETYVGERGVKLSVGQKQRLAIARVLLKDPPIIVFDEATSSIDTETEVKIREALNELTRNRTTFIIAHRLATLQHADRILVLMGGRIIDQGKHDELIIRSSTYRTLYETQFHLVKP
tara:strand:+ start:3688 stop:5436 length:1749 start_codon:yes stop_codon:yes gene_type:complete